MVRRKFNMEIKYTLEIKGMMCGHCEAHVNDAIKNSFEVKSVNSDRTKNQTIVVASKELDEEKIKTVVKEAGYDLVNISKEETSGKRSFIAKIFKK